MLGGLDTFSFFIDISIFKVAHLVPLTHQCAHEFIMSWLRSISIPLVSRDEAVWGAINGFIGVQDTNSYSYAHASHPG